MPLNNVQQPKLTSRQSKANALAAFVRADVHAHTVADKRNRDEAGPPQQAPTSLASVPSLPPGVVTSAGADIALRITVSKVVWRIPSSPNRRLKANISLALQSAKVLVDWWGAENLGIPSIALRPSAVSARRADPPAPPVNAKQQRNTDTALFPIISSKSNFCAYLRDMGTLVLRVVNKDNESIGTARIPGLQVVAGDPYSKPITGWYPIMSETVVTHQLGELHFSAVLETFKTQSDTSLPQASRMEAPAIESASRAHSTSPARTQKPRENDAVPKRASTRNLSYQDSNDLKTTVQNAGSASTTSIPLPTRISASSLTTTRKNVGFDKRETQRVHAAGPGNDTGYDSSDGGDSDGGDNYGNYANTTSASHGIYDESAMEIPQTPPLMAAKPDNVSLKRASHVSDPLVGSNQGSNIVLISTRVSSAKVQSSAQSGMEDVSANAENSRQSSSAIPLNHPSSAESIPTQPSRQPSHQSVSSDLPSGQTSQADKDAYEDIYTRAVRLKERISEVVRSSSSLENVFSSSAPPPSFPPRAQEELSDTGSTSPDEFMRILDENHATDSDYRILYQRRPDHLRRGPTLASEDSDSNASELLDDDLIINALNSRSTSQLLRGGGFAQDDDADEQEELERILRQLSSEGEEEEVADVGHRMSPVRRTARSPERGFNQMATQGVPHRVGLAHQFFNLDTLTKLGRVHSVRVYVAKLETRAAALSPFLTSFVVDYEVTNGSEEDGGGDGEGIQQLVAARMVSSALPRILSSSGAVAGKANPGAGCVVAFDKQDIFPVVFDGKMAVSWLESSLDFQVVATQNIGAIAKVASGTVRKKMPAGTSTGTRKTVWQAHGSWKCREVLAESEFYWSGKVPLFAASEEPKPLSSASSRKEKPTLAVTREKVSTRHIADLVLTVELISNPLRMPKVPQDAKTKPMEVSAKVHDEDSGKRVTQKKEEGSESVPISHPPPEPLRKQLQLPPHYVFISITTARGLAVFPSANETSPTLLHLSLRLFSSSTPSTTTPPVPYLPPFDLATGRLNTPLSFDYAVTVPVAITPAFLEKARELVVEVWALSPHYPENRTTFTKVLDESNLDRSDGFEVATAAIALETCSSELVEDGKRLLGLIRLPFDYLVSTMAAGLAETGQKNEIDSSPILLPETEYAIMDPFSGISKGWVKSFLALGTWPQIVKLQRGGVEGVSISPKRKPGEGQAGKRGTMPTDIATDQEKVEQVFMDRVAEKKKKPKRNESLDDDIAAASTLLVTVHAACGLRGLISSLIKARESKDWLLEHGKGSVRDFTTLDVAHSMGPNAYIILRVFPRNVAQTLIGKTVMVMTQPISRSFSPKFEHSESLQLQSIDTDLLRWIKQGEKCVGEVWHQGLEGSDTKLGTFAVPLGKLLNRPLGIRNDWFPVAVVPGHSSASGVNAAVQVSIQFKNGMEFTESENALTGSTLTVNGARWVCQMKVSLLSLRLSNAEPSDSKSSVFVRCDYDMMHGDQHQEAVTSMGPIEYDVEAGVNLPQDWKAVEIDMSSGQLNQMRDRGIVFQVLQTELVGDGKLLGYASLDLWDAIAEVRKAYRKRDQTSVCRIETELPLINPDSEDLASAVIGFKIEFHLAQREPLPMASIGQPLGNLEMQIASNAEPMKLTDIALQITIERGLQLPTVFGLCPNCYVTIDWPTIGTTISTHIVPNNESPSWKYQTCVNLPRTESALRAFKFESSRVEVVVWHCDETAYNLGTGVVDASRAIKLGVSQLDLAPLFTGCLELYGWYPLSGDTEPGGQILIRVVPAENLGSTLMEVSTITMGTISKPVIVENSEPLVAFAGNSLIPNNTATVLPTVTVAPTANMNLSIDQSTSQASPQLTRPSTPVMLPLSLPVEPEALPHLNVSVISASPILSPAVPTNAADDVLNVGAQVSAVRSENVEAGSEIEEFSRSLQRTVNELNTLQDLIRSRGIKALPIVSTTSLQNSLLNMHSENVNNDEHDSDISAVAVGTGVEASNDFSLSSTHQRTDKVDVMEIEVDCFHQDSGPKLTLEDLNFDFADDSGPEEHAVTQEASSVSAAELHRSESNIEVSQEQHRFGHTSPNLSDSLSLSFDSIQRQSRQRKLGSTPMGQTGILKAENGHTAQSLSDEDDDEDTDAFIHSLLKSHRRENSPMISATNDSSPPRPKSSLHMEIKSTAEKYLELTHHQTLHRSHKTQDTDDSLQFPDSDSDSSSDDLYGMYKVVNRHKFADKGSSPLSSDAIVAAVNKSHVRSGRAAQDSRLKKLLALADGQNSDMTDSQSDYSDSDFSLVFASPERKVGGMNKSRASSPNEKAARGTAAKARHADDEEIREILARSRQTRAEALEKVAQMKQSASILEQPPLRKPYAKILSEITFSNSTVDTRPPRVPIRTTADRNASDIFTKGEAERVSRIFKNVK